MVTRALYHHHRATAHSASRFPSRKSPLAISFTIFCFFVLSIFVFLLYTKNSLQDEEQRHFFPGESHFHEDRKIDRLPTPESDGQLWDAPISYGLHKCVKPTMKYKAFTNSERYMTVRSNGGLNQMRTGIADMVAVARIMNATLVIPQLDKKSFWHDSSVFSDIFDEIHFLESLRRDVRIVRDLPKELETAPRVRKHFGSWSSFGYYEEMTHLWKDYQVIHVAKSDSRLANNDLPLDIQRLRCRALYQALRFSSPIERFGKT